MSAPETGEPRPNPRRIDLHTHSTASDGLLAPADLVQRAADVGLDLIGLVDHDTTSGLAEARAAGARLGVAIVAGVEINTDLRGGEAHILGYYISPEDASLTASLGALRDARERRGERMANRLREAGYDISWERVRQLAGGAVGRPHVARALIEAGYATDVSDAFARYLSPGGPGFIPRYKLAPEDAVRIIRAARGIPALAHPRYVRDLEESTLARLVDAGLQGLECYYGQYDAGAVARLLALARQYGLIATGGSDYHGPNMHPTPLGGHYVPPEVAVRLWEARQQALARPDEPFTLSLPEN